MSVTLHVFEVFWSAAVIFTGIVGVTAGVLYLFIYALTAYARNRGLAKDFLKALRAIQAKRDLEREKNMPIRVDRFD